MAHRTIAAAAAALRSGSTTSAELTEDALSVASMTESQLHAYLTLDADGARAAAARADEDLARGIDHGPLHGIPVAVKDNMVTEGVETTCSSRILSGYVPPYDATVIARLRAGGAVITGKTNLDEFAMGSSTEHSAFGASRNPWDTDRVPGGSSGGSAVTVAAGSALAALGSDTGGSIRQPASLCGVVGMKPTYGLVSRYGLIAFASSLDQIGPFTHTVADAVDVLDVIAGHDPRDATSIPEAVPNLRSGLGRGLEGLRIGVVSEMQRDETEPGVKTAVARTVDQMAAAGAQVSEVALPSFEYALSAYYLIAPAECSANLARFDGVRYGNRVDGVHVADMMSKTRAEGFGAEVTRRILLGTYALSAGHFDAFYNQALKVRTLVRRDLAAAYQQVDVLVGPTSPTTAFELGAKTADPLTMYLTDVFTIPANLSGDPAISVPVGLDEAGLPIGFQIMAPALGEPLLFQVAQAVEALASFDAAPELSGVAS